MIIGNTLARLLAGAALLASAPVLAQASVQDPAAGPAERDVPNPDIGGEDVVVTAQKIEQRAVDVPITISAVTGERIAQLGVGDLDELSSYVPGLNIQEQSANNPGIVIRGITSDSGSAQQGARVTLYYNGVDISRSRGAYQAIYDLERVEVVKGPQATLFGTASAVGAVSLVSAKPRPGFSGAVTAGYGNYDATVLSGFVNAGNETLAGRVAFEWKTRDGYVRNLAANQYRGLYEQDQLGVRASVRYRPDERMTLDLVGTYDRQRNGGTPFVSRALPPGDPFGAVNLGGSPVSQAVLGLPGLGLNRDVYDANVTIQYEITPQLTFTTVNGYRQFDSLEVFDADGSAAWFLEFAELAKGKQASHEGRFSYADPMWRASFGWNVFLERGIQNVPFSSEEGTFLQCAGRVVPGLACVAADGTVPAATVTSRLTGGRLSQVPYQSVFENGGRNDAYSVFADATFVPVPRIELTAGARVLIEQRRSTFFARVPRPVLNPTAFALIATQVDTGGRTFEAGRSYSAVLPRFNALFRLTDRVNVFGTVSKGRRSPIVQLNAARVGGAGVANRQFIPEENVWNYEGGLKAGGGPVSGTLGVFYQKYDGFQVSVVGADGVARTQSAGTASNLGVEAELNVRPARWVNLFGNVGWIDGGIDRDNSFAPAFSGARFRLQPEWQAAGGLTLDVPLGGDLALFATPSATYRSRIFFELPNNPAISQRPVFLVNARAGVKLGQRFELAGFLRNATNKRYLLDAGNTGGGFGLPTFIPAEPRFYGAQLTARY